MTVWGLVKQVMKSPSVFGVIILLALSPAFAQRNLKPAMEWKMDMRSDLGWHLQDAQDLAIHRHQLEFEQIWRTKKHWTFRAGGRARVDGSYAEDSRNSHGKASSGGQEISAREIFAHYQKGGFSAKLGSQTVVWGEAFNSFYADIVNPKDLRERGIGDLAQIRRPIEALNIQYIAPKWSIQGLYLPTFRPNQMPHLQSDFFPSYLSGDLHGVPAEMDLTPVLDDSPGDVGVRVQTRWEAADISFFYMSMIDRQPALDITLTGDVMNPLYIINAKHTRMSAGGLTFSWADDDVVVRAETVMYSSRAMNLRPTPADIASGRFSRIDKGSQWVGVVGFDGVLSKDWVVGVQYSEDILSGVQSSYRAERESMIGLQIAREWEKAGRLKLLFGQMGSDGSYALQPSFFIPRGRALEVGIEGVYFGGSKDSVFGSTQRANRLVLAIRGFFRG